MKIEASSTEEVQGEIEQLNQKLDVEGSFQCGSLHFKHISLVYMLILVQRE